MDRIFYKKTTAILFVTAILVLLILVCMLLVSLTQLAALNERVNELTTLIERAKVDVDAKKELLEYMRSNDYVRKWAEEHDRISGDDIQWLNDNL